MINVSDIVEANGKTIKENNLKLKHLIPIGTLVEINIGKDDYLEVNGARAFVVEHTRDCDGTPLYSLSLSKRPDAIIHRNGGWSEDSLIPLWTLGQSDLARKFAKREAAAQAVLRSCYSENFKFE